MVISDRFLADSAINPGGFNALVSEELLNLFDWHTSVEQIGCAGSPEPVWMDMFYLCGCGDSVYDVFQSAPSKTFMWSLAADEKGRVIVCTGIEIIFKVDVGAGIEVCHALTVSLAQYSYIIFDERNV